MNDQALQIDQQVPVPVVSEAATLMEVISNASRDPATDVGKLERLMAMYKDIKSDTAQQEFNTAIKDAQREMRPVEADMENKQTRSKYASYAALDKAIRPIYTSHGFGVSFDTSDGAPENHVRVLAYVSHSGGFTRTYQTDMPNDGKGARGNDVMSKTHATGAAMAYGMRYLLKMIFNIAVGEDDRDGNDPSQKTPTRLSAEKGKKYINFQAMQEEINGAEGRKLTNLEAFYTNDCDWMPGGWPKQLLDLIKERDLELEKASDNALHDKNKESLSNDIQACETLNDLGNWWKDTEVQALIKSMPQDWQSKIVAEKDAMKVSLEALANNQPQTTGAVTA